MVSRAWHSRHRAFSSSPPKACALWHDAQAMPPLCAPVSDGATLAWQLVQVAAMTTGSSAWGAWQVTHAAALPWLTWMLVWQRAHAAEAPPGAWGVWQLMQTV